MIDKVSLTKKWLDLKHKKYPKSDPGIIERVIYALYLLEQLKLTGLDFIFKGGTSLQLIMDEPSRFSVDIDIIVKPSLSNEKLEAFLEKIKDPEVFIRVELDERRSFKNEIPKAHYKFIYNSNVSTKDKSNQIIPNPEREILLDILFMENPYALIVERPIKSEWISQSGETVKVITPDINSITGDKLTAFAPSTIGVPYKAEKEREIMKQLFDIGVLFDLLDDLELFRQSFLIVAENEIQFRSEKKLSISDVLNDIIETGLILARRDQQNDAICSAKFIELSNGIRQFGPFLYKGNFRIEEAQLASAKAAYLAAIHLTGSTSTMVRFEASMTIDDLIITHPDFNFLNKKLKNINKGEALFYWRKTIELLYP
jgi:hypothetical protein